MVVWMWIGAKTIRSEIHGKVDSLLAGRSTRTAYAGIFLFTFLMIVREDSGVKTLEDLNGKGFSFGLPGSGDYQQTKSIFQAIGINVKEFVGSYGDAVEAMKDRRIVGISKTGIGVQPDASIVEVAASTKLRALGFTPEQLAKIRATSPDIAAIPFLEVPAGAIKVMPGHPAFFTHHALSGSGTTPKVPQDIIYKVVKALDEHWKDTVVPSFAGAGATTPNSMDTINAFSMLKPSAPLHAGVVQYFLEKGLKVPDSLIPPEFKK